MRGLRRRDALLKRTFDVVAAFIGLLLTWWLIAIAWAVIVITTGGSGLFTQQRVGRHGRLFRIIKLRTMRALPNVTTDVTTANDPRITSFGRFLRRSKIDELPQLWNILRGDMSFVGPRPDVPGFADMLEGDDRVILEIRPGITGPATLVYRDEEKILAAQDDPELYNRTVLYPEKTRINLAYVRSYSFTQDMRYIAATVLGRRVEPPKL
jgi:lipopolysaccharide/colanic/teichoic acid biosynthesis glycosyltransferase